MSMSSGDMSMGSMSMGDGVPGLFYMQKMYWAVVGSAIAAATVVNVIDRLIAWNRLRDSSSTPAKPKNILLNTYATLTAAVREISYVTIHPISLGKYTLHFPPLGPVLLILANIVLILVLCFYKLDTADVWKWEDIGYRTGFITICQLPLIFLLAGRQNIIGFLAGMSYARLNWFHRWAARSLWLTATIHMGFWFRDWARYDYIVYQLQNDPLSKRGFIAWCILTFIVLTSSAPVRRLSYEIFVLQHVLTFVGFIVAVWFHAPQEVKLWVWIPIGLVVFDRVARYTWAAYTNLAIFHRKTSNNILWKHEASFAPLPGNVTRVTIQNPSVHWQPGQHVFLTCHSIVPLQSHPFTIASLPSDNKMEFLIRAENGGTRRFFKYASKKDGLLGISEAPSTRARVVFIEGPYGSLRPLRQFDSVVLLAGGMGATFIIPLLRDIVSAWKGVQGSKSGQLAATKRIRFIWVIKSRSQLSLFETQIQGVLEDVEGCRRTHPGFDKQIDVSIYMTCDEKLDPPVPARVAIPDETITNEKIFEEKDIISIREDITSTSTVAATGKCCAPGGGCCCTKEIRNEDEIESSRVCNCSGPAVPNTTETKPPIFPSLTLLSGRPHPRTIIQKVLEQAEGESAVVVCGPRGLGDDVRRSVVSLSDERAVHKGTGAQGIYLHVENFGL
ncbi:hypothetical protein N7495_007558 [Penicillium taxi]|uniref:uncharacterized protein n=1 Tax=Penicillium taxi TaxID=168475 RepID=UPI00254541FB|nr:uncharacterized protein N7495_007558 [Penicillium taxi]KAJ5887517.1 hypothetical protein N7495_007558 [Penicillium taxi]